MAKGKYLDLYDEFDGKDDRKYITVTGRLSMSLPALDKSPREIRESNIEVRSTRKQRTSLFLV